MYVASESPTSLTLAGDLRPVLLRLNNLVRRRVPSAELTAAQSTALTTVLDHGPIRMGELAEREQVRMPTATSIIRRVEKLDLVRRRPDPEDGRAVLVELTETGRERLTEVGRARNDLIAALLDQLDAADRESIAAAVPALTAMLALDLPGPERRERLTERDRLTSRDFPETPSHSDESEHDPR